MSLGRFSKRFHEVFGTTLQLETELYGTNLGGQKNSERHRRPWTQSFYVIVLWTQLEATNPYQRQRSGSGDGQNRGHRKWKCLIPLLPCGARELYYRCMEEFIPLPRGALMFSMCTTFAVTAATPTVESYLKAGDHLVWCTHRKSRR